MTCEVAVMNKRGIALAADSAVTLGNGKKIYHTAEKLFSLSPSIPVAIMTFGAADMMNVPWETVVKIYAQKLGSRSFDTLDQYAKDFLSFIESATSLFPPEDQKNHVKVSCGPFGLASTETSCRNKHQRELRSLRSRRKDCGLGGDRPQRPRDLAEKIL